MTLLISGHHFITYTRDLVRQIDGELGRNEEGEATPLARAGGGG